MKTIYKYTLNNVGIEMPIGAEILTVQIQNDKPCIWAMVDPEAEKKVRHFQVFGTGQPIPEVSMKYIGTYQELGGSLVWHVFID